MPGTIPASVGIEDCRALRRAAKDGLSARGAVEEHGLDIHPGTARTHASGGCRCETDEDSHPFRAWERQVNADDCSRLRKLVGDGLSVPDAVDELGLSGTTGAAGYHVRGDCRCETDVPTRPAGTTGMDADDCAAVRKFADRGLSSTAAVEELELDVTPGRAREHARGKCSCDTDVSPVPFDSTRTVTSEDCGELRRLADRGLSASAAINRVGLDVHPETARNHAKGDCKCDTNVPYTPFGSSPGDVTATDCGELRQLAKDGLLPTDAIEAIGLDIQPATARNHANDNCTCPTDVPPHSFRSRGKDVSAEDCGELRRLARDGLSPAAAIEEIGLDIQPETARQHANDDCTCSTDVPSKPFASHQRGISAENCGELRRFASEGLSAPDAIDALGLDISPSTTRIHARGDCTCSTDVPSKPFASHQRGISAENCGELRRFASEGLSAPDAIDALGLDISPSTARIHARGDCTCETDVSDTPFDSRRSVSEADCGEFRRLATSGYSAREAIEDLCLDVDPATARYHVDDRCSCDTDVPPHSFSGRRGNVSASDCVALRRMAREGTSARAARDTLGLDVTTKAAGTHAGGDCNCGVDVEPHSFGSWSPLSDDDCAGLRRRAADGMTADDAIDDLGLDICRSAACRHARGDCTCDPDVSSTSFGSGRAVSDEDCGALRRLAADGSSAPAAMDELGLDVDPGTVYRHAGGDCTCDTDVPKHRFQSRDWSRSGSPMPPEECADIRRQLESGVNITAVETTYSRRTVKRHGTGECSHEIDVPAVRAETDEESFTSEMCKLSERLYFKEHYHTGQIKAEIDDQFQADIDESTIKYHLVEDCDHPP